MTSRLDRLVEEYARMADQARNDLSAADFHALQVFLRKLELRSRHERGLVSRSGIGARARARRVQLAGSMAVQTAASMDRILATTLARAGRGDDWNAHIERVRAILGPWPPVTRGVAVHEPSGQA